MQEMKYFIPNETFDRAIQNKEKGVLRALLIGIIGSDPTFATSEYEEASAYVERKSESFNNAVLNLNESLQKQEGEYQETKDGWSEEYYQMLLVWYRDNYADERLQTIKEVGKDVYRNKPTLGKSKKQNRLSQQVTSKTINTRDGQPCTKDTVVRATGNDEGKERLAVTDWLRKNWWMIAAIGACIAALYILFFGNK